MSDQPKKKMSKWYKLAIGLAVLWTIGTVMGEKDGGNPDRLSYGYMPAGECMSGDTFNSRTRSWVSNANWSSIPGSATWSSGTKTLAGSAQVMSEMVRLGTKACADLNPIYQQYLAAQRSRPSTR
jgi:hypothetical protein